MKRADEGMGFLLRYENVAWYEDGAVRILDRRVYPMKTEFVVCKRYEEVAQAIADMVTQSAGPYTAASMGMVLALNDVKNESRDNIISYMEKAAYALSHARPTTAAKMEAVVAGSMQKLRELLDEGYSGNELVEALRLQAVERLDQNYRRYEVIAEHLFRQIPKNGTIMTQCFAETIIGTLLLRCRKEQNQIRLICPETRPYFQGARLTASLACDMGFDVTVITDNMPAYVMQKKQVDLFTSAADVITMDGHIVNKVGTFQIAIAAAYMGIPYFATGIPNAKHPDAASVRIEERDPELSMEAFGIRTTLDGVKGFYPAFDITPPKLVNGVVTDQGIFSPYDLSQYQFVK